MRGLAALASLPSTRVRRWLLGTMIASVTAGAIWWVLPYFYSLPETLVASRPVSVRYLDREGSPLRMLLDEAGTKSLSEVSLSDIPQALIDATVAVEDQRFESHGGVDGVAVVRAMVDNFRAGRVVSGASTLAQQLVKISRPPEARRDLWTKWTEAQMARRLLREWPRERILETYLNRVSYGNQWTGCAVAAWGYFSKPLSDLTSAECALLAGLPQSPTRLDPLRHPEAALKRQRHVLERMVLEGRLNAEQHQIALQQPMVYQRFHGGFAAPHAVEMLRTGLSATPLNGEIRTTIDGTLQRHVETLLMARLKPLRDRNVTQAAAVILHNPTGEVRALAGSRDFASADGGQINGAWSPRSPGSALKPFTYLLAFERGRSPADVIADLPVSFPTPTGFYQPVNYDHRVFGPVTARTALGSSLNIAAVKWLDAIGGAPVLVQALQDLGITTLTEPPEHYGLGLTIGNAPVRLLELANAYACLARLGQFMPWRLLAEENPSLATTPMFDERAAFQIADVLSDNQARLQTFGAGSPLRLPFRAAIKTGTSTSYRDNWTLAYTPEWTVGVWVGNFDRTPMQRVSGVTGAAPIAGDLLRHLHAELPRTLEDWFTPPAGLEQVRIDPRTGKRINPQSPVPRVSRSEWVRSDAKPPPATAGDYDAQGRAFLSPEYDDWIKGKDNWLGDLVVSRPDGDPSRLDIVQPRDGGVFHLDPDLPDGGSRVWLRSTRDDLDGLEWTTETLRLEESQGRMMLWLEVGEHLIRVRDRQTGETAEARIRVIQD